MRGSIAMYVALMSFVLFAIFAIVGIGYMFFAPDVFAERGGPITAGVIFFAVIYTGARVHQRRSQ